MTVADVLQRLDGVKREREGQWAARCPAHGDKKPSLAVKAGEDGKILLHCHAGCRLDDVLSSLQIAETDLFPDKEPASGGKQIVAVYPYRDEGGAVLFEVVRFAPKDFRQRRPDPAARDGYSWRLDGVRRVLYRLPELLAADKTKPVFVVEGEKDVEALREKGAVATCNPHGAGKWKQIEECAKSALTGRHVVVIPDNDEPGRKHAAEVAASLQGTAASVRVLELGGPGKDAADWLRAGGTVDALVELARAVKQQRPELVGVSYEASSSRLDAEREERQRLAKRIVPFNLPFLDDALGGMYPRDIVVLTARSGAGKTELASTLAESACKHKRRVLMFALEAEDREIERRMKYRTLAHLWVESGARGQAPSYRDWYSCAHQGLDTFEGEAKKRMADWIGNLHVVYRSAGEFTVDTLERTVAAMEREVDVVVIDHLHFIDSAEDESENAAVKAIVVRIRNIALRLCKPVVLVAHIRKASAWNRTLVPQLDEIHGSSDTVKVATKVVSLAPAPRDPDSKTWWLAPTYIQVLKDRLGGGSPLVARMHYNTRLGVYQPGYDLGWPEPEKGGETWTPLADGFLPAWASRAIRPAADYADPREQEPDWRDDDR